MSLTPTAGKPNIQVEREQSKITVMNGGGKEKTLLYEVRKLDGESVVHRIKIQSFIDDAGQANQEIEETIRKLTDNNAQILRDMATEMEQHKVSKLVFDPNKNEVVETKTNGESFTRKYNDIKPSDSLHACVTIFKNLTLKFFAAPTDLKLNRSEQEPTQPPQIQPSHAQPTTSRARSKSQVDKEKRVETPPHHRTKSLDIEPKEESRDRDDI